MGMIWNLKLTLAVAVASVTFFAGATLFVYGKGEEAGRRQVMIEWQEDARVRATAEGEEIARARQREEALAAELLEQRMRFQREVGTLRERERRLLADDRMRDRPEARDQGDRGLPGDPGARVGCTGAGLSRPDAEFLVGLAADAARTQAALDACRRAYDDVRGAQSAEQVAD
jgi:hypothetical protein